MLISSRDNFSMKCETCQELLSEYIDGQLSEKTVARVKAHLTLCEGCTEIYNDFSSILGVCDIELPEDVKLPNEQALWCRINNIIESEIKPEIVTPPAPPPAPPGGWFSRMLRRSWSLSPTQAISAVLAVAVLSSLLTVVGLQNYSASPGEFSANASAQPTLFERMMGKIGLAETPQQNRERRMKEQQVAIDYWNKRVEARRAQWDKNLRDVFDRNLSEIDQIVSGYNHALEQNPQDELSNEMLDSAMSEKVELLREFSEL
jgi:hypothetical protein